MAAEPVTLTVSSIRQALAMEGREGGFPTTEGSADVAAAIFHATVFGLLSGNPDDNWQAALDGTGLDEHAALRRHAYDRFVGPLLARNEASFQGAGQHALWLWQSIGEFCQWFCELLQSAAAKGMIRQEAGHWAGFQRLLLPSDEMVWEIQSAAWRAPIRIVGIPDLILYDAGQQRWCYLECRFGTSDLSGDLGQAALYARLISSHLQGAGSLALVRFAPERRELELAGASLAEAEHRVAEIAGRLAGVSGPLVSVRPGDVEFERFGQDLVRTLTNFGLEASQTRSYIAGPAFVRYTLKPGRSTPIKKIVSRAEDLGIQLGMETPFVEVEDGHIIIDFARRHRETVPFSRIRMDLPSPDARQPATRIPVGLDLFGRIHWVDFGSAEVAHMLVAGTSGSGKTEWLRLALTALMASNTPDTVRFVIIDQKGAFRDLQHSGFLLDPGAVVAPPNESVTERLDGLIELSEFRTQLLQVGRATNLAAYCRKNGKVLPRIFCIFDEYGDLGTDRKGYKEIEEQLVRLGAKARATGIHVIMALQNPDARLVTTRLQSSLSARVCLRTASWQQSLVSLKQKGAERLLGSGDLLYSSSRGIVRLQAPLVEAGDHQEFTSPQLSLAGD